MNEIKEILVFVGLSISSVIDIKSREVSLPIIFVMALAGIFLKFHEGILWNWNTLISLIPGVCCICFSKITNECIGYGDSYMILTMGLLMNLTVLLESVMIALFIVGLTALFLIVFKRKGREYELPFIPFLLAGYGILVFTEI